MDERDSIRDAGLIGSIFVVLATAARLITLGPSREQLEDEAVWPASTDGVSGIHDGRMIFAEYSSYPKRYADVESRRRNWQLL